MPTDTARLIKIAPSLLGSLRQTLNRVLGDQGAQLLQEAGFSSGNSVYDAFSAWLGRRSNIERPEDLDSALLGEIMSEFFTELGWGSLRIERVAPTALAVRSNDWAEADTASESDSPCCHVTTGILAAFLGRMADSVVAVMEVECRSRGDDSCRFLVGSPETLQTVFDGMASGADYQGVLAEMGQTA